MAELEKSTALFEIAKRIAKMTPCNRHEVGAVIVDEFGLVFTGYNHAKELDDTGKFKKYSPCEDSHGETLKDIVIHAEEDAIDNMDNSGYSYGLVKECYVTHAPCGKCADKLLKRSVKTLFYEKEVTSSIIGLKKMLNRGVEVYKKEGEKWVQINSLE